MDNAILMTVYTVYSHILMYQQHDNWQGNRPLCVRNLFWKLTRFFSSFLGQTMATMGSKWAPNPAPIEDRGSAVLEEVESVLIWRKKIVKQILIMINFDLFSITKTNFFFIHRRTYPTKRVGTRVVVKSTRSRTRFSLYLLLEIIDNWRFE